MKNITNIKKCRVCSNVKLIKVISIKKQYLSPTFVKSNIKNSLSKLKFKLYILIFFYKFCIFKNKSLLINLSVYAK